MTFCRVNDGGPERHEGLRGVPWDNSSRATCWRRKRFLNSNHPAPVCGTKAAYGFCNLGMGFHMIAKAFHQRRRRPEFSRSLSKVLKEAEPEDDRMAAPTLTDALIEDAVREIEDSGMGSMLSCIAGKLAHYVGESGEQRLLLRRAGD